MTDITGRTDFTETWLMEMPEGLGSFPTYDQIEYSIKDRIKNGSEIINVGNNIKKIVGTQVMYYWVEDKGVIVLGTEVYIKPQGLVVTVTGKHPDYRGSPPYASDLYSTMIKDNSKSVRLFSDTTLSDEGYSIWKRLLNLGNTISVYDKNEPGKSFVTLKTPEDMEKYFANDDYNFRRYQYVLSETGEMLAETHSYFNTRRMRELIGTL